MSAPTDIDLEAAKFLHELKKVTEEEPETVVEKLYLILQHMRSSGKENSVPFQVISRALKALIMHHESRDLSLNSGSQSALTSGMDEAATKIKQPRNISLLGFEHDVGYDMTTESLPKEQLHEPQKETYSLEHILVMDLTVEDCIAGKNKEIVEIEDDLLLDHSHQLQVSEGSIHHKGLILGAEKGNSSIYVLNKTCTEEISKRKKPEKGVSYEILSEHFGKPLDDAAESFNVSRSTFKRMCRDHGITRWKSSKRRMGSHSSSKHGTVNDDELSRNPLLMVVPPLQDTTVVALPHKSQDKNKINVKATYKGTVIRFELLDLSGVTELEDMVIERLKLKRQTFSIKYQDDEGDWVLIACDNDVQKCIEISRSSKNTIIKMLVDPPISG